MQIKTARLTLEVETRGDASAPPLVLIRGLGSQIIHWPEPLLAGLTAAGHHLILFDNRDAGLSDSAVEGYRVEDMADDVIALLDGLGIEKAAMLGISMGGMILQSLALRHPDRLTCAVIIMSSSAAAELPRAAPEVLALLEPDSGPQSREEVIAASLAADRAWQSPAWPFDEVERRALNARAYDRAHRPDGTARQLAAITALRADPPPIEQITTPTLVIHGSDDTLLPLAHGQDIARRIPGAQMVEIKGMGHDISGGAAEVILTHTVPFLAKNRS